MSAQDNLRPIIAAMGKKKNKKTQLPTSAFTFTLPVADRVNSITTERPPSPNTSAPDNDATDTGKEAVASPPSPTANASSATDEPSSLSVDDMVNLHHLVRCRVLCSNIVREIMSLEHGGNEMAALTTQSTMSVSRQLDSEHVAGQVTAIIDHLDDVIARLSPSASPPTPLQSLATFIEMTIRQEDALRAVKEIAGSLHGTSTDPKLTPDMTMMQLRADRVVAKLVRLGLVLLLLNDSNAGSSTDDLNSNASAKKQEEVKAASETA